MRVVTVVVCCFCGVAAWTKAAAADPFVAPAEHATIDRVHVVWMNHLDVGYTNLAASVMNDYFHVYARQTTP